MGAHSVEGDLAVRFLLPDAMTLVRLSEMLVLSIFRHWWLFCPFGANRRPNQNETLGQKPDAGFRKRLPGVRK